MSSISTPKFGRGLFSLIGAIAMLVVLGWVLVEFGINRIYVPEGYSMQLQYKGPPLPFLPGGRPPAARGEFATPNEKNEYGWPKELGILENMVGPGRHFYCPLWWKRTLVPDVTVQPGELAVVTSRMGKDLPKDQFLVDGTLGKTEFKGIMRQVLTPGTYRINPYAYKHEIVQVKKIDSNGEIKHAGWVEIPTGYVGVVTNLTDNLATNTRRGIQEGVLPPGLYPINHHERHVDIVEIGYREQTITANIAKDAMGGVVMDASGEPMIADDGSGITFPSKDSFNIQMDFTAIWGVMPHQAPEIIRNFGNVDAVEEKVVLPQINSICRNVGSRFSADELMVGETRLTFQKAISEQFNKVLSEKDITMLYGLVRHIYIPQQFRLPIQSRYISQELKLTREQEQLTTKTEALLGEAKQKVQLESERIHVETERMVAQEIAEGQKTAAEIAAETGRLVAEIERQTAEVEAEATIVLGEATANAKKMLEEAKAQKFKLAVEAFGSGEAYNQWVFATGLPEDIQLNLLYAGEGTFWTDLKGFTETMLGRQIQENSTRPKR